MIHSTVLLEALPALPDLEFAASSGGAMAPGHDAFALARVVELRAGERVLDLGTGVGTIALMLAAREAVEVVGLERDRGALAAADSNARRNAARLRGAVHWLGADLRQLPWLAEGRHFDLVVMNPPYYRRGEGRVPDGASRAGARHEIHGTLSDWIRAARLSLRPGGRLACVHRPARMNDLSRCLREQEFGHMRMLEIAIASEPDMPKWIVAQAIAPIVSYE